MTDKNFINALAERMGKTKKDTKEFLDAFEEVLKESVGENRIKIADLNFVVKNVSERNCVNPSTREKFVVPAHKKLVVKPSNKFKCLIEE